MTESSYEYKQILKAWIDNHGNKRIPAVIRATLHEAMIDGLGMPVEFMKGHNYLARQILKLVDELEAQTND